MPIQVECPSCRASIRVRDEHAGRRGACPHCKVAFAVPMPTAEPEPVAMPEPAGAEDDEYALADAPRKAKAVRARAEALPGVGVSARGVIEAAAPTRKTLTPRQVLAAFGGRIEPVRPTILYRLWILIVAAVMVLLPLVYLGIIGLVVAAVVYHAIAPRIDLPACPGRRAEVRGLDLRRAPGRRRDGRRADDQTAVRPPAARARRPGRSTRAKSRCCTPSWTASAIRSARRGRRGSRSTAGSTPRRTARGASWASWAAG